jgi:hypothetical protein
VDTVASLAGHVERPPGRLTGLPDPPELLLRVAEVLEEHPEQPEVAGALGCRSPRRGRRQRPLPVPGA